MRFGHVGADDSFFKESFRDDAGLAQDEYGQAELIGRGRLDLAVGAGKPHVAYLGFLEFGQVGIGPYPGLADQGEFEGDSDQAVGFEQEPADGLEGASIS